MSRGYIVASIEHTYINLAVWFPDGRVAPRHNDPPPAGLSPEERFKWTVARTTETITEGAADVRFALDRITAANANPQEFLLAGRLDLNRVAAMGHSAGGHLAMTTSTLFDAGKESAVDPVERVSSRPDFAVLGYPVISMVEPWAHRGSRTNLLGDTPDPELAKKLSGEQAVVPRTPPTFIFQTNEDTTVPAENAVYYYLALRKAGVPAEMHIFERGPHGVGLANDDPALSAWSSLLANWLRGHGVIK